MKSEDKVVNYRPELVNQLQKAMEFANTLYSVNFQKMYYESLEIVHREKNPDLADLLHKVSLCFEGQHYFDGEVFYEEYEKELAEYNIHYISEARAAYALFKVFESEFDKLQKNIETNGLTKIEQFMVNDFFKKLKTPMRNPNIEIKDGATKCYYDNTLHASFKRDLKDQLEWLNQEWKRTIEIFNTPDEPELDIADNNEDIEVGE